MPTPTHTRKTMRLFNHPAFVYAVALAALGLVLTFALIGISVAEEADPYRGYAWVPRLLAGASVLLIVTTLFRILRRLLLPRRKH